MLDVFLLPAFTRLGHKCQDLLSPCDGMHVCTELDLGLYSYPKEFWGNGVRTHVPMLTPREKSPPPHFVLKGGWEPQRCIKQGSQPDTLPTSYSAPPPPPPPRRYINVTGTMQRNCPRFCCRFRLNAAASSACGRCVLELCLLVA